MKRIPLTRGQFALVDDEDFERLMQWEWQAQWNPCTKSWFAVRSCSKENGRRRKVWMHREIMSAGTGEEVDHKNHDTLDNRREFLRLCTRTQNMRNRGIYKNNVSGYKGVTVHKQTGKWRADVQVDGKQKYLGLYQTAAEAAIAYDTEASRHFGEFALTNRMLGLL